MEGLLILTLRVIDTHFAMFRELFMDDSIDERLKGYMNDSMEGDMKGYSGCGLRGVKNTATQRMTYACEKLKDEVHCV